MRGFSRLASPHLLAWSPLYAEPRRAGLAFNDLVKTGKVAAPIVIGRDLDCGSVASPSAKPKR